MLSSTRCRIGVVGAWCGPAYLLFLLVGWVLFAGFLPPTPPNTSADGMAAVFQDNTTGIRVGMVFVMWAAAVFIPFAGIIAYYVHEVERGLGVLTMGIILGGAGNMVLTFYPAVWWLATAYRPERDSALTQLLNDAAWLQFIGGVSMFAALPLTMAIVAFCDKSANPVFPRWAGYFNLMVTFLIVPDQLLFFFHDGPWAWNGLFGLWIPLTMLIAWYLVSFWLLRQAVLRDRANGTEIADADDVSGVAIKGFAETG